MFYYHVVQFFPSYSVFQLQRVFLINFFFFKSAKGASVLGVLLLATMPCHACYVTRQTQAARPLFRMTK